ncbi:MAG TPA: TrkH family potassium uptake protein [Gammaproteobacteria bacterium]|nr:TrkH family potassium uptake protein [Gammaproteobacteria bacterium]
MHLTVIIRTLGVLFLLFSTTLLPPLAISLAYADGEVAHFSVTLAIALAIGLALWLPFRRDSHTIRSRDGFLIVALMWSAMSLLGTVPFILALDLSFPDAFFESVSGYTTTGATVLEGLDSMSPSILFYRQEIQWLGGIGVIVLAVALLPMLGIGGMQLYKAETAGPLKDERFTPRLARTARGLVVVYLVLTTVCAGSYWLAGMGLFDAVAHSLSTVATAGYSTHDASLAFFDSVPIELVATIFMLIGGISFNEHFIAWRTLQLQRYGRDTQTRGFLLLVGIAIVVVLLVLLVTRTYESLAEGLRYAVFEVVSVFTTTGYGIADFSQWPLALPVVLIFTGLIGGCAGSSAGGIKVIRIVVLFKQVGIHIHRLIHPQAIRRLRVDGQPLPDAVVEAVGGFFAVYIVMFFIFMALAMMDGMDQVTAFGAVAATISNLGPGLGDVAITFADVSPHGKIMFAIAMLFGRLEIYTFLVLLAPAFWRR